MERKMNHLDAINLIWQLL